MDNYDDGYKPRDLAEALSGCLVMIGFFHSGLTDLCGLKHV